MGENSKCEAEVIILAIGALGYQSMHEIRRECRRWLIVDGPNCVLGASQYADRDGRTLVMRDDSQPRCVWEKLSQGSGVFPSPFGELRHRVRIVAE